MRLLPFFLFFSAAAVSSPTAAPPPPLPPSTAFHLTGSLYNKNNNLVPLCHGNWLCLYHWHCPRPYSSLNYLFSEPYFMLLLLLWVLRFSLLLWKTVGGGYSSWSHSSSPWPSSSSSSSSVARGRFVKRNSLSSFFSYFRFLSLLAAYLYCCCCCEAKKVARLLSAISLLA